jgi:hypothetical protein
LISIRTSDLIQTCNNTPNIWNELVLIDSKLFNQGQYLKTIILALIETIIKEIQSFENSSLRLYSILKGIMLIFIEKKSKKYSK